MEGAEEVEEEVEAAERRTRCVSSGPAATVGRGRTAIFSTLPPRPIHLAPSAVAEAAGAVEAAVEVEVAVEAAAEVEEAAAEAVAPVEAK